ncbi:pectinesterase-like [Impatiens glandulifera]|uniref:pectinesterase-like n=1 Tax=Impatiens glandulifera TaxID=253017 RepID=UPI001FB0987B|nr:pectinesterase-like [Impatiens glandulifera]
MAGIGSYGKVNPMDQDILHRKRKNKRIIIIGISTIVLVGIVIGAVVGTAVGRDKNSSVDQPSQVSATIKATCGVTLYPDTCVQSVIPMANSTKNVTPQGIFRWALQAAINELSVVSERFNIPDGSSPDNFTAAAFANCRDLLELAMDHLNDTANLSGDITSPNTLDDMLTWLSAAGTYQQTCLDDFEDSLNSTVSNYLKTSSELTSNSLAIVNSFAKVANEFNFHRRLLNSDVDDSSAPSWLSRSGRRLLQAPSGSIQVDAIVAKDGSGKYKTISAALKAVPEKSKTRFIIYVKKGVYQENVVVSKNAWNVMIIGDGLRSTIVTGNLNVVDGTPTFQSATFTVNGKGFIARDMGFRNTAGAIKHQAVALLSTADQSVFYGCSMDAFQDTLYPHSNRQFYRECTITGTVDFIFGNAAVVFQNCTIVPRLPMSGQQNTITAQGKLDPNQNTGISIQGSTLIASNDLKGTSIKTYLGRPWKDYSTTIFFNSNFVGSLINPAGWLPWVGNSAPATIFYAEYQNFGTSASTKNRVKWSGLKLNLTAKQVAKFTVNPFIDGANWLPATAVPFVPGL